MPSYVDDPVSSTSHTEQASVVAVNDFAPTDPPGAGGNAGWFESAQGEGVRGTSNTVHHAGVVGVNTAGGWAIYGTSDDGIGIVGESKTNEGVRGSSHGAHAAVVGINDFAPADQPDGGGPGGYFESTHGEGLRGTSASAHGGVVGVNTGSGAGVYGQSASGLAAHFEGDVVVTGDLKLAGADYAEALTIGDVPVEPGMVTIMDGTGLLMPCDTAYDQRVAGIVSGAGGTRPAIVLDEHDKAAPIAMMGTAWCWCDAANEPIAPGDPLTTSDTVGHAQKASDSERAHGAVVGKAMTRLTTGTGLVRVLVAPR